MSLSRKSSLQENPKSKVLIPGYINIYSNLNSRERLQIKYKTLYKKENPQWDETQVYLAKKFHEFVQFNTVVLDAGCGNGNYIIDENRQRIFWAIGVDASKDVTKKNICLDEIVEANLEELPFESNKFDAVTSLWVFEHLQNPDKVFNEIHRVLKSHGVFFFCAPNKNFLPLRIVNLLRFSWLNHYLNLMLFGRKKEEIFDAYYKANTLDELRKLSGENFEVIELRYNSDPGYTSFNDTTYRFSNLVHRIATKFGINFTYPHILGILKKSS